jgi:Signal transduction histidine kinase
MVFLPLLTVKASEFWYLKTIWDLFDLSLLFSQSGILAHDIKTPLTSVIGYLSLLDEAPDMPPQQKAKYVGITLEKAYRLEQLINEFFEITRFNLQTIVLNKEKINLMIFPLNSRTKILL